MLSRGENGGLFRGRDAEGMAGQKERTRRRYGSSEDVYPQKMARGTLSRDTTEAPIQKGGFGETDQNSIRGLAES